MSHNMTVDDCFRDTAGKTFNEFMPVNLVLGPYVNELQAAADMHIKSEDPADSPLADGQGQAGPSGRCETLSLEEGRASSGQSATEPLGKDAKAFSQGTAKAPDKLPRWKTRTAEQYIAHRHNQHKYRVREKQRLQELSATLHDLSFEMHERQIQEAENDYLQKETEHLEKLLREKTEELAALQSQTSAPNSPGDSGAVSTASDTATTDADVAMQTSIAPLDPTVGMPDHQAMHEAYHFVVNEFKQFLATLNLWPIPVSGHVPDVNAAASQRIHEMLKHLMTVCMEMSRLSNAMRQDVRCYLHATAAELDNLEHCQQPATFDRVVHQLQLSQSQRAEMLKVRKQWRDYLASIYDERQQLNNEVLGLLTNNTAAMEQTDDVWRQQPYVTPHSRANIVYADKQLQPPSHRPGTIRLVKKEEEQKVESMQAAQQRLPTLLAKLEANLAKELCHISEQDHLTMTHLLKPVQAAWFVILVFPDHCDCLALLNAVQRQHDSNQQSTS